MAITLFADHHVWIVMLSTVLVVQVYTAEHSGHTLAIKLFRYSSSMDHGHQPPHTTTAVAPAAALGSVLGHSGTSGSSSTREAELESVLSLQYRLCSLQHEHILQHVAVYPRVFEVSRRWWLHVCVVPLNTSASCIGKSASNGFF